MKRLVAVLLVAVASFATAAGAALADTPQGKLTGGALVDAANPGSARVEFGPPVIDGGTSYVGAGNDLSGKCTDDSGVVKIHPTGGTKHDYDVLCAHYVASSGGFLNGAPKMRFAFLSAPGVWTLVRITDNGSPGTLDTIAFGSVTGNVADPIIPDVINWVNKGVVGAGFNFNLWGFTTVEDGNDTVHAS